MAPHIPLISPLVQSKKRYILPQSISKLYKPIKMSLKQSFISSLIHWSFGFVVLVGLVSSEFTTGESITGVILAAIVSIVSAICSSTTSNEEQDYRKMRWENLLNFLITWLEALIYLIAASTCARLASATIDYISQGHFREFLFGMEQHSLGEPWPDVLGVTIILVVTVLFMMGLERSTLILSLLCIALLLSVIFFSIMGNLHTINPFQKLVENIKVHSARAVLKSAALCSFAYVQCIEHTSQKNILKIFILFIVPVVVYVEAVITFSLMTRYRELVGSAIPLVQVFENRDVDWARPVAAVFTVSVVCLLLTEIMPNIFNIFVKLSSKQWSVFVSSIQFRSQLTGAPVLAIFAAGSLAAILAFACPLFHLIKLLNVTCLVRNAIRSCQMVINRYKAECIESPFQVQNTDVLYSRLNQETTQRPALKNRNKTCFIKDKIKNVFSKKPVYIHRLSSPKNMKTFKSFSLKPSSSNQCEEQEFLLEENISLAISVDAESYSETEETETQILCCGNGDDSDSSTDIDLIVEEYKEGLKVAAVGNKFNERKQSTNLTSILVMVCLIFIVLASINVSLYMYRIINVCWPNLLVIILCSILITSMPSNLSDRSKPSLLPTWLFGVFHSFSVTMNILLASTIVADIWEGIVFWTLAGLFLYWRFNCCECFESVLAKATEKIDELCDYRENLPENIFVAR